MQLMEALFVCGQRIATPLRSPAPACGAGGSGDGGGGGGGEGQEEQAPAGQAVLN